MKTSALKLILAALLIVAMINIVASQDRIAQARLKLSTPEIVLPEIGTDFQVDLAACDTAILKIYQVEFDSLAEQYRAQSDSCAVLLKYHRNK